MYGRVDETGHVNIETEDSNGDITSTMAETWNGWTHVYEKGADIQ